MEDPRHDKNDGTGFLFSYNFSWNQTKEESQVGPEPEYKVNTKIWDVNIVVL